MRHAVSVMVLVITIALLFSSCSFSLISPVESLMRPPVFSDSDEELYETFIQAAGEDAVFSTPVSGDYTSAIVIENIDSDEDEEALVFYRLKSGQGTVRVNILDSTGGSWASVSDLNGSGSSAERLMLDDLDGDGVSEILVAWKTGTASEKTLSVYRRLGSGYKEVANENYSVMSRSDMDGDSLNELLLVSQTTTSLGVQNSVGLFKLHDSQLTPVSSAKLDGTVSSYASMKVEYNEESDRNIAYVDALKGETGMITEVIYFDSDAGELVTPFLDEATLTNSATFRIDTVPSMDINNDGVIDIPVQRDFRAYEHLKLASTKNDVLDYSGIMLTSWMDVSEDELTPVLYSVLNPEHSYIFCLEEKEINTLAVFEQTEDCWTFSYVEPGDNEITDLFSLLYISEDKWEPDNVERYTVLSKDSGYMCAYVAASGKSFDIADSISERFDEFHY